jgi:hypothetical protein
MTPDSIPLFPRTTPPRRPRVGAETTEEHAMKELRLQTTPASSSRSPPLGERADGIPADEWQRRFMARIHAVSGFNVNAAATWPEGYRGLSKGFEADPEAAASAHLSYWLD